MRKSTNLLFLLVSAAAASALGQPIFCGMVISTPGTYYLTGNLNCSSANHGVIVAAHDVTIDLRTFTLNGSGAKTGIINQTAFNPRSLTVLNGRITNWDIGIWLTGYPTPSVPVPYSGAYLHRLRVSGNALGVYLYNLADTTLYLSTIELNTRTPLQSTQFGGVVVEGGMSSTISTNSILNNRNHGLYFNNGQGHKALRNTLQSNASYGIRVGYNALGGGLVASSNRSSNHHIFDAVDHNPACAGSTWSNNVFGTTNQSCVQ